MVPGVTGMVVRGPQYSRAGVTGMVVPGSRCQGGTVVPGSV